MAKNPITLAPDLRPDRRKSRVLPIASLFVVAPLLIPLIVEVVSLCYAQWCEMLDTPIVVHTPRLNWISKHIESIQQDISEKLSSHFQRVPWNPKVVLPLIALIMAIAIMMLRL